MVVAKAAKVTLQEIVVEADSELEKQLKGKAVTGYSLPMLELGDGTTLT